MEEAAPKLRSLKPAELFNVINLDYPGLEAVKEAAARGDRTAALTALLAYYRQKFPLPDPAPALDDRVRVDAENIVNHTFQSHGYAPVHYPDPIDWEWDPHGDIEWVATIYRFAWARPLAAAYAATRDERYAKAFVELASDWISKHPLEQHERTHRTLPHWKGFAWLDIQTGIRASSLCVAFPLLVHAESFTPEFLATLLASFYDHQIKSELIPMKIYHNKALMELNGYVEIAALLPEFKDAPHWLRVAQERLWDKLQGQVSPDGVQREWSFGYHCHVLSDAHNVLDVLTAAGLDVNPEIHQLLHRMYDFLFGIATPELSTPMFGDTRRETEDEVPKRQARMLYGALQRGARAYNEPRYRALAEGDLAALAAMKPALSYAWTQAGLYVMRSAWDPEQIYFALHDSPPPASSHDQDDNGTFELYAYGRWLMTDTGYYTYGHDAVARRWHRQTAVHQTLTLDGKDSHSDGQHLLWVSEPGYDIVSAENPSYPGLTHRRTVWFVDRRFFVLLDEAIGDATGTIDLHYQFAPGNMRYDPVQHTARTLFPDANVLVWLGPDAPVELDQEVGWTGWSYNKRTTRPACRFRYQGSGAPAAFVTLLVPYRGLKPPEVASARLAEGFRVGTEQAAITVSALGETWQVGYDLARGAGWCKKA